MGTKKMGRPTDDPKRNKVSAWINDEDLKTLDEYCKRKGIKRPQGIRDGIKTLKNR